MSENTKAYADSNHKGNGPEYYTGKPCLELGCEAPAGTAWSPYWRFKHNVERIDGISKSLKDIAKQYAEDMDEATRGYNAGLNGAPKPDIRNWNFLRGWIAGNKKRRVRLNSD